MTSKIKKFIRIITLQVVLLMAISNIALAAPTATPSTTGSAGNTCATGNAYDCLNQGKTGQIMKLLEVGLNILAAAVGVTAVIMLIIGGIQYSSSNGNPQAVAAAKQKIINVLIGLAAFIFLYAFLQWLIPGGNRIF